MSWCPQARIKLSALQHNLAQVRSFTPNSRVMAVVKADAYGHGLLPIAQALHTEVDMFAVARLHEAITLRASGISVDVLVLEGVNDADELALAVQHRIQLVVHHVRQIDVLEQAAVQPARCWLKIDTGMHRLGIAPSFLNEAKHRLMACSAADFVGLMTHLANADDPTDPSVMQQVACMAAVGQTIQRPLSIANSAGIVFWPDSHADWVRPGLMLYGASPCQTQSAASIGLQSVMTLSAALLAVRQVQTGDRVGYGGTWQATEPKTVGVVGIGYGDGYPRQIDSTAYVLINQQRATILGCVSMDMLVVDLQGIQAQAGDRVILWGDGLPVDVVAAWADTIPYTLLTGVTPRVSRHYGV